MSSFKYAVSSHSPFRHVHDCAPALRGKPFIRILKHHLIDDHRAYRVCLMYRDEEIGLSIIQRHIELLSDDMRRIYDSPDIVSLAYLDHTLPG